MGNALVYPVRVRSTHRLRSATLQLLVGAATFLSVELARFVSQFDGGLDFLLTVYLVLGAVVLAAVWIALSPAEIASPFGGPRLPPAFTPLDRLHARPVLDPFGLRFEGYRTRFFPWKAVEAARAPSPDRLELRLHRGATFTRRPPGRVVARTPGSLTFEVPLSPGIDARTVARQIGWWLESPEVRGDRPPVADEPAKSAKTGADSGHREEAGWPCEQGRWPTWFVGILA